MEEGNILKGSPNSYLVMQSPVETDLELIRKALEVYIIVTDTRQKLTPSEMNLMVYYMKMGYSEEAKSSYIEDTGMSESGVNVTNNKLRNKGYLIKNKNRFTVSYLAPDIEELRASLFRGEAMNIVIRSYEPK